MRLPCAAPARPPAMVARGLWCGSAATVLGIALKQRVLHCCLLSLLGAPSGGGERGHRRPGGPQAQGQAAAGGAGGGAAAGRPGPAAVHRSPTLLLLRAGAPPRAPGAPVVAQSCGRWRVRSSLPGIRQVARANACLTWHAACRCASTCIKVCCSLSLQLADLNQWSRQARLEVHTGNVAEGVGTCVRILVNPTGHA